MKKIFILSLILVSLTAFGQTVPGFTSMPSRYNWINGTLLKGGANIPSGVSPTFPTNSTSVAGWLYLDTVGTTDTGLYYWHGGWVKQLSTSDTANRWVRSISRTPGVDSIIYYIGANRFAIKDSIGSGSGSGTALQTEPYGMIMNDTSWNSTTLGDYFDVSGSVIVTDSANMIVMSNGPGAFTASLNIDVNRNRSLTDYFTNLEYWDMEVRGQVVQTGIIGIGIRGTQATGATNAIAQLNTSTGASAFIGNSASNLTLSIGDRFLIKARREGAFATIWVRNITTNSSAIETRGAWEFTTNLPPRIGQFAIFLHSGKVYIDSIYVGSTTPRYTSLGMIGTSKFQGLNAQFTTRLSAQLNNKYATVNWGSGSSVTAEWENIVNEIIAVHPQQVIIENPCNDLRFGVNVDSTKARYSRIATRLRAAGIAVYYLDAIYETNSSPAAWLTYINSWADPDSIIYVHAATSAAGNLDVDNIHQNVIGQTVTYSQIVNSNKLQHSINNEQAPGNFTWNQSAVRQNGTFSLANTGTTRAGVYYLTLGTGSAITSVADMPLRVEGLAASNVYIFGSGSDMYVAARDDNGTSGAPLRVEGSTIEIRTTAGVAAINMASTGAVTINNGGVAINTRIASDNQTNMFLIDGTNDRIGIGVASPTSKVELIAGSATANTAPLEFNSGATETVIRAALYQYNGNHYISNVALNQYGPGGAIADFTSDVANSGTTETDLYTYTTKANTLNGTGDKIVAKFVTISSDITASSDYKVYFAGTQIYDSGVLGTTTGTFNFEVRIIRTGASTARATVVCTSGVTAGASGPLVVETDLTSLTFSGTNIIKITGQAGGAGGGNGDLTAKMGSIYFYPAANN